MKNRIVITFVIVWVCFSCKAQSPIIPLYDGSDYLETTNAYYKDTDGDLAKLVGTWQYAYGNGIFKITIKKKAQFYRDLPILNVKAYEDMLYGEYRYVNPNNVEINNSLGAINQSADPFEHLINGNFIMGSDFPPLCNACEPNERRVKLWIEDPGRSHFDYVMYIRFIPSELIDLTGNGDGDQLELVIYRKGGTYPADLPSDDRLPIGTTITLERL